MLVGVGIGVGSLLGELAQVLLALGGLLVGFGVAIALDRCVIRKKKSFAPRMVAICGISPAVVSETKRTATEAEEKVGADDSDK